MALKAADVLEMPPLGMRIVFVKTAAETGGQLLEYEVVGRPKGFPAQAHVHPLQSERHEVVSGALLVRMNGRDRVLGLGASIEIPAGTPHRHYAAGSADAHVRVTLRPALRTEELLARLADLSRGGEITTRGYLKPLAAARLILDFPQEGHAAQPPVAVQRAFARLVTRLAEGRGGAGEYVFVDDPGRRSLRSRRRRAHVPDVVATGLPGGRERRAAGAGARVEAALQGPLAVPPPDALDDQRLPAAPPRGGRRDGRPTRTRPLDTDAGGQRHPTSASTGRCSRTNRCFGC